MSVATDIVDVARVVEIHHETNFAVNGFKQSVPPAGNEQGSALIEALSRVLYGFYCRLDGAEAALRPTRDPSLTRSFVASLSEANCGTGTFEPGWRVVGVEDDGRVAVEKDGLALWVARSDFQPTGPVLVPGVRGRVKIGKELRWMFPGFYFAIGNGSATEAENGSNEEMVRVYWAASVAGAVPLVRMLTSALNQLDVPFRLKLLTEPTAYLRADAAVLYFERAFFPRVSPIIAEVHAGLHSFLAAEAPRFTLGLAQGLGVAEDPHDGRSFGQHRCLLAARGLWEAYATGRETLEERVAAVAEAFVRDGLDPAKPHLGKGSRYVYTITSPAVRPELP